MGLTISVIEIPLLTIYAATLSLLHFFRPRKSLSGKCFYVADAAGIWEEEWEMDSIKPGSTYIFEGSTSIGQYIYIEIASHKTYNAATIVLGDAEKTICGQFTGAFTDSRTVKCGPLFLEMREPFRRWRISFRGYLTNDKERNFVTLSGWWKPTSDARFFNSDLHFGDLKYTNNHKFSANIKSIIKAHFSNDMSHFGVLHVEVTIDDISSELRFRGVRQIIQHEEIQVGNEFHVYMEDGNRLTYKSITNEEHDLNIHHGYMERADLKTTSISLADERSLLFDNHHLLEFLPPNCSTIFCVLPYLLRKNEFVASHSYTSTGGYLVNLQWIKVNNGLTNGYALIRTVRESLTEIVRPQFDGITDVTATNDEKERMVVPFSLRSCQDKEFTGGKGANLAKLKSLENMYYVPNGAVVTTTAFNRLLHENRDLMKMVYELSKNGLSLEEYVMLGENIAQKIKNCEIPYYLIDELKKLEFPSGSQTRFAVRSSAIGEDGSDLSSAGQLESVLNITFNEIPHKILECWSSNFRKEVISYRRNYGQVLNPLMAVVIQEMVTDGIAGVMFTCDPVKNVDERLVINAIKGCGEDIVSGVVTPDEIIIEKTNLKITQSDNCCLNKDAISKLVSVGLRLEKIFGTAQDVEFIVKNDNVYLVQSRDVTGRDRESRFELLTEFDGATLTEKEVYTTANVGEVVPWPMSPFEASTTVELFDRTMTNMCIKDLPGTKIPRHHLTAFFIHGQRLLFNIGEMFLRQHTIMKKDRLPEISIAGCPIFTDGMFEQARIRYGPLPRLFIVKRLWIIANLLFVRSYKLLAEVVKELKKTEDLTPKGEATFKNLWETFNQQKLIYRQILEHHSDASMFSSFTYIVVGALIRGSDEGETTPEIMSDLANIFSNSTSCVISADVPSALRKLAKAIKEDGLQHKFLATSDSDGVRFLKTEGKQSAEQIDDFLKTHGHRGPKELYLRSEGWAEKSEMLISTLKTMLSSSIEEKTNSSRTTNELMDSLKCQPKGFRRWLMKYMVSQAHRGVASRELAKSCLVKSVYELRKTTKMMAKMLYDKGMIPDEDLFFFMHSDEVLHLYHQRNAKILARAMRRRQIFSELEARQYAHIYYGNPDPVILKSLVNGSKSITLMGTVVCEGRVVASARVAANLEEAKHTKPGEILITRCTDICWSPYFPIIKGIVTEIGGLLSHGAVVAREYGLPSLIAVEHATAVFKTGDIVELDTYKGTISKLAEA